MNVEVKKMPAYHVAYLRRVGPYGNAIGALFDKLMGWACAKGLTKDCTVLAVYWDDPQRVGCDNCRSDACVTAPKEIKPEGDIQLQTLPEGMFAVYHAIVRNNDFVKAWNEILIDWLPKSGYKAEAKPCYEIYLNDATKDPEGKWIVDICVPVRKK